MVDFNYCDHECACQHNGHLEAAQQYSSLLSKVMNKNADSEPVSKEEKDKWNNKANQDVVDLIKTMVEKHEEKLDELEDGLDKKVKLILYDLGFGDNVLAKYATIEYVNELVAKIKNDTADLSKYALKTDLDTIKNDIQNKINNLTTEINNIKVTGGKDYSIESFNYTPSNGQLVLKQKNGGEFTVSIVAGGIDTSKLVTKEQLINELTKYAEINKLKKLQIGGNQYTLYDPNGNGVIKIDAIVSGGGTGTITADVTGETRYLYLNSDNTNKAYSGEAGLHLYNSGTEISFSHEFESLRCSNGSTISGWNGWFRYSSNVISMTIPEGKLDMSDGKYWTLRVKLTPTDTAIQSNVRYVDIQFYGIVNGSSIDAVSYRLDTSTSVINYQDGSLYPSSISFYLTKSSGDVVTQIYPNEPSSWTFSYSTDGGSVWNRTSQKEIKTEGRDGMYFRAQNGSLDFKEYVPIIKAPAVEGINGVTYKIEISDMSLSYKANKNNKYNISSTFTTKLYKKEGNADYALQKTNGYDCNVSTNPSIEVTDPTKNTDSWLCTASGEVSNSSATIQIVVNKNNGAFVDSVTIPISAAGKDGNATAGQTLKGSPLRMSREVDGETITSWRKGLKYYDGKREADTDGIFYQDVTLYNNSYYVCVNSQAGDDDNWEKAPGDNGASYWSEFALSPDIVVQRIIANQGFISELSTNEVVVFSDKNIVAGMTSSRNITSSKLDSNIDKGNVRIWAGKLTGSSLNTAPFTVTDTGALKSTNANITGQINATSGSIGNFNISEGSLITGESKLEIGTESGSESSSGRPYRQKVTIDAQGHDLSNYNYMLCVESSRLESTMNPGTTAGVYIDVDGHNSKYQYCGINMPRGQFWGLRCATRHTTTNIDFRNIDDWETFVSGMTVICTGSSEITITLPNKDFAKEGDEFTVLKGNDDYESQQVSLSYTAGHAVGRLAVEGMGARIIFANGKWRICHYN